MQTIPFSTAMKICTGLALILWLCTIYDVPLRASRIIDAPVGQADDLFQQFVASFHPSKANFWEAIYASEDPNQLARIMSDEFIYKNARLDGCVIEIEYFSRHIERDREDVSRQTTTQQQEDPMVIHLRSVDPSSIHAWGRYREGNHATGSRIEWDENGKHENIFADTKPEIGAKALKKLVMSCRGLTQSASPIAEQSPKPLSADDTEALTFIREKLVSNVAKWSTQNEMGVLQYSKVDLQSCQLAISFTSSLGEKTIGGEWLFSSEDKIFLIDLPKVAPNTVIVKDDAEGPKASINWEEQSKSFSLGVPKAASPDRVMKAFLFLTKSCGAKDSKF